MAHPSAPGKQGLPVGCLVTVLAVCAAATGGVLWVRHAVDDWLHPPGPDVGAIASSPSVSGADRTATTQLDAELTRIQGLLPWARPVAQALADSCSSSVGSDEFGSRPTWGPVVCDRTVVWFGAVDGPLPQALTRLDRALEHAGMRPAGTAIDRLYAIDHARSPTLESAYGSYGDQSLELNITVDTPGDPQQALLQDRELLLPGSTPPVAPTDAVRAYRPIRLNAVTQKVKSPEYLIGVSVMLPYYTQPASSPTPASEPTDNGGGGCMTGSGNCPGG